MVLKWISSLYLLYYYYLPSPIIDPLPYYLKQSSSLCECVYLRQQTAWSCYQGNKPHPNSPASYVSTPERRLGGHSWGCYFEI